MEDDTMNIYLPDDIADGNEEQIKARVQAVVENTLLGIMETRRREDFFRNLHVYVSRETGEDIPTIDALVARLRTYLPSGGGSRRTVVTEELIRKAQELRAKGKNFRQIAKTLGCSYCIARSMARGTHPLCSTKS